MLTLNTSSVTCPEFGDASKSPAGDIASRAGGKQEFRRTDFGSRLLAAEGEGGGGSEGEGCV